MSDNDKIYEAMELIQQALSLVDEAVEGHESEQHYYAYGRYGLN